MINLRIISVFILFNVCLTVFSQNNITINWPLDSNTIQGYFYESETQVLYVGIENQFRIEIPDTRTRDLQIVSNNQDIELKEIWRPIIVERSWFNALAEYTFTTAKAKGAFVSSGKNEQEMYLDTNGIYWEKEYSISSSIAQKISFSVYKRINDSTIELYNSFELYFKHVPIPTFTVESLQDLKTGFELSPNYNTDFRKGNEWYMIQSFAFTTYDKKDRILFSQKCIGNFITPEMHAALENSKLHYVLLSDIQALKYEFNSVKLFKKDKF